MTPAVSALLQADPAFAAGAASFSAGLERLTEDGWVTSTDRLREVMLDALTHRWNSFDRYFLVMAHAAAAPEHLVDLDHEMEGSLWGQVAREASRRAGTALLGTWTRLGLDTASRHRDLVLAGAALGHLPVVQGAVCAARGLLLTDTESVSCWTVLSGLASSAVRLGVVGHRAAQEALLEAAAAAEPLLQVPADLGGGPWTGTPVQDIAVERHRLSSLTLFAS